QADKSAGSEETPRGAATATPPKPSPAQPQTTSTQNTGSMTPTTAQTPPEKGMVWVNLSSGVYHREGDRWYGKTKNGKFMSESDAQKAGYRASKSGSKKSQKRSNERWVSSMS